MRHLWFVLITCGLCLSASFAAAQSTGPDTTRARIISSSTTLCGVSTAAPIVSTTAPNEPPETARARLVLWVQRHRVALLADIALGAGPHLDTLIKAGALSAPERRRLRRQRTHHVRVLGHEGARAFVALFLP